MQYLFAIYFTLFICIICYFYSFYLIDSFHLFDLFISFYLFAFAALCNIFPADRHILSPYLSLSHSHSHAPFVKCCRACFAISRTVAFGIYTKRRMRNKANTAHKRRNIFQRFAYFYLRLSSDTDCETRLRFICFTILNLIVCFYFDSALSLFSRFVFFFFRSVLLCFYSAGAFDIPTHPTVVLFHSSS